MSFDSSVLTDIHVKINEKFCIDKSRDDFYSSEVLLSLSETYIDDSFVTFSNISQIPPDIFIHYTSTNLKCSYGCFPSLNKYYVIIDNKLFLWTTESETVTDKMYEPEAQLIVSLSDCIIPYSSTNMVQCMAIATPKYIKIVGIKNDRLDLSQQSVIPISFTPTCLCPGPKGYIFCGSTQGDVFIIDLMRNGAIDNITAGSISQISRFFTGYIGYSIFGIECDSTGTDYCYWNSNNDVSFMSFNSESLCFTSIGKPYHSSDSIISVSCVGNMYFEIFTNTGSRLIFGPDSNYDKNPVLIGSLKLISNLFSCGGDKAEIVKLKRIIRSNIENERFIYGASYAGYSILCSHKSAYFFQNQHLSYDDKSFVTYKQQFALPGIPIVVQFGRRPEIPHTGDAIMLQHLYSAPSIFLLTTSGSITARCQLPYNRILHSINKNPIRIVETPECGMCEKEIISSLLLLSCTYPDLKRDFIYSLINLQYQNEYLSVSEGVLILISRLLSPLYDYCFFIHTERKQRNGKKWIVNPIFQTIPSGLVLQIQYIIDTIDIYVNQLKIYDEPFNTNVHNHKISDYMTLRSTIVYLKYFCEVIHFVCSISQQKSNTITHVIEYIIENNSRSEEIKCECITFLSQEYLFKSQILIDEHNRSQHFNLVLLYLKDFARMFFILVERTHTSDALASKIASKSPTIFSYANSQLTSSLTELEKATFIDKSQRQSSVTHIVHTLLTLINEPNFPLLDVCEKFRNLELPGYSFQISIARSLSIDPEHRALRWLKDGRSQFDFTGANLFKSLTSIYQACLENIDCPDGLRESIEYAATDELFAYFAYQYAERKGHLPVLIESNAPFLEDYLQNYNPVSLWQYYIQQGNYKKAAEHLYFLSTNVKTNTLTRITWATQCYSIVEQYRLDDLSLKVKKLLITAMDQQKYETENNVELDYLVQGDIHQHFLDNCNNNK